jgi:hypothetical protein
MPQVVIVTLCQRLWLKVVAVRLLLVEHMRAMAVVMVVLA